MRSYSPVKGICSGEHELAYAWVIERTSRSSDRWLLSDWDGNERWVDTSDYSASPDWERLPSGQRRAVVRTIGTGKLGQYYRFERRHY